MTDHNADAPDLDAFEAAMADASDAVLVFHREKYEEMLDELGEQGNRRVLEAKLDIVRRELASGTGTECDRD